MQTLKEYIESVIKKHDIRIKFCHEITDEQMDKIEQHLQKYDVEKVSAPSKTILQKRPRDFPQVDAAEIYIIDFTATLPVSTEMLRQELSKALNISEAMIVVRNANEPGELDVKAEEEAKEEEYKVRLTSDYDKAEGSGVKADELYGDKYNTSFLKELKKMSETRKKEMKEAKIKDPDVPASSPEIGDSKTTNKVSPVATRK